MEKHYGNYRKTFSTMDVKHIYENIDSGKPGTFSSKTTTYRFQGLGENDVDRKSPDSSVQIIKVKDTIYKDDTLEQIKAKLVKHIKPENTLRSAPFHISDIYLFAKKKINFSL